MFAFYKRVHINVNRSQVISGAAWVYERYNTDKTLPALQREEQLHKRGLWAYSRFCAAMGMAEQKRLTRFACPTSQLPQSKFATASWLTIKGVFFEYLRR